MGQGSNGSRTCKMDLEIPLEELVVGVEGSVGGRESPWKREGTKDG